MSLKRNDHFFLFTLIDFLLQCIFVGLITAFLLAPKDKPNQSIPSELIEKIKQIGISNVTELIKTASKLVPIDKLMSLLNEYKNIEELTELTVILKSVRNIDELKRIAILLKEKQSIEELESAVKVYEKIGVEGSKAILETHEDKLKNILKNLRGLPPCFKTDDGKTNPLFTIHSNNGFYEVTIITNAGEEVAITTGLNFVVGRKYSATEFSKLGMAIKLKYPNCNNAVTYYGDDNSLDSLLTVQESFNTLNRRSRAR